MAYRNNQNDKKDQEKLVMEKQQEDLAMEKKSTEDAMMKKEEAATIEKETTKEGEAMEKEAVMSKHGSYVTLADYNSDPSKYSDSKKVYFFHASWCPICQKIDKEITADTTKVPAGVTIIKTDFDSSTELRKKYGVNTQYTLVQVDASGNETAQWSATSTQKAFDGIKS